VTAINADTMMLDCTYAKIGDIYSDIFRNAALTDLDLRNNKLTGFVPSAFKFLPAATVSLSGNQFWYDASCSLLQPLCFASSMHSHVPQVPATNI